MTLSRTLRRCAGAGRAFLGQLPEHLSRRGPDYPPLPKRLSEQARLLLLNAVTASDYYALGLHRPQQSWVEKRQFLGHYLIKHTYGSINAPQATITTANKKIFQLLCIAHGLPVIDIVASYAPRTESAPWPCFSSLDDLRAFLLADSSQDLFLKPTAAQRGFGALSLGSRLDAQSWENLPLRTPIGIDQVMAHVRASKAGTDWIVQRRARPHPQMAHVVPDVCSTVRVITLYDDAPTILGALVRFGEGNSPADNYDGGGIISLVDLETGTLGRCLHTEAGLVKRGEHHPYTGAAITGMQLPDWDAIKELALAGACAFHHLRCVGWDIAITDKGPVVLEGNSRPGVVSFQSLAGRGVLAGPMGALLRPHSGMGRCGIRVPVPAT